MKYKGEDIGDRPSLELVREVLSHHTKYNFSAEEFYYFFEARNWKRKNGRKLATLETTLGTYYGIFKSRNSPPKKLSPIKQQRINLLSHYENQLKDRRWYAFREFIFAVRGKKCEICGSTTNLQIHHPEYIKGRLAWEYTCNEVLVVCDKCHKKIHGII